MIGTIERTLVDILTEEMITNVGAADPTRCRVIKIGSLQDDPTTSSPYILIKHHPELGSVPGWSSHRTGMMTTEVGGGEMWTHFFSLLVRIYDNSKDNVLSYQETIRQRLIDALLDHCSLNNLEMDSVRRKEKVLGFEQQIITSYRTNLTGGDTDWFGEIDVTIHYHTQTY